MRYVQARCTEDEYFLFIQSAKYYGVSMSDFIKKSLKNNVPAELENLKLKSREERRPRL